MRTHARVLCGGFLSLMIVMGIGRFAYTPLLPAMQSESFLDPEKAGLLASINYLGYLAGAFLTGHLIRTVEIGRVATAGLLLSAATTAAMGISSSFPWLAAARFGSGLASAFAFIATSGIVIGLLAGSGEETLAGIFYGGVGTGIILSGLLVPPLTQQLGAAGTWLLLGAVSLLLTPASCALLKAPAIPSPGATACPTSPPLADCRFFLLLAVYGLEGFGYIITGTFMVVASKGIAGEGGAAAAWVVAGIAAAPSAFFWSLTGRRFGPLRPLIACFFLQVGGIILPVVLPGAAGVFIGAFLFGATFMGIVTLTFSFGCSIMPSARSRIIALLTGVYGIGQVIGPTVAGIIAFRTGSYNGALSVAAIAVFLAAILVSLLPSMRKI